MKVSKIILASLLGAVAINSVMADEYDGSRNRCKAQSDKVWVEETKYCASVNPCTAKKSNENEEQYCIRDFKDVETNRPKDAAGYAELYLHLKGGYDISTVECVFSGQTGKETSLLRQNYIACTTPRGGYFVFEFDDTTNSEFFNEGERERLKALKVLCGAAGGQLIGDFNSYNTICRGVSDLGTCKLLRDYVNADEEEDHLSAYVEDGDCKIGRDHSHAHDTFSDKIKQVLK